MVLRSASSTSTEQQDVILVPELPHEPVQAITTDSAPAIPPANNAPQQDDFYADLLPQLPMMTDQEPATSSTSIPSNSAAYTDANTPTDATSLTDQIADFESPSSTPNFSDSSPVISAAIDSAIATNDESAVRAAVAGAPSASIPATPDTNPTPADQPQEAPADQPPV